MEKILTAICAFLVFNANAAAASTAIKSNDPNTMVAALQSSGYTARLEKSENGDPLIRTATSGYNVLILFMGCTGNRNCQYVELLSYLDCEEDVNACIAASLNWQKTDHFGGAVWLPESKLLGVYHFLATGSSGISDTSLIASIEFLVADVNNISLDIVARKPQP